MITTDAAIEIAAALHPDELAIVQGIARDARRDNNRVAYAKLSQAISTEPAFRGRQREVRHLCWFIIKQERAQARVKP